MTKPELAAAIVKVLFWPNVRVNGLSQEDVRFRLQQLNASILQILYDKLAELSDDKKK